MDRELSRHTWDAIVIGAGPAGAVSGLLLAREGLDVLIIERKTFPRTKVCGGCLNGHAIGVLRRAGVLDGLKAAGARGYRSMALVSGRRRVTLDLPGGLAVSRLTLDGMVAQAAVAAGCSLLTGATGTVQPDDGTVREERRLVQVEPTGQEAVLVAGRVVIAADGLARHSLRLCAGFEGHVWSRSRIGLGTLVDPGTFAAPDHTILMAVGRSGYVGAVQVEAGRVNVAAAVDPGELRAAGAARCVAAILREAGVVLPGTVEDVHWQGTPPLTQHLARPVGYRLLVVGDASGYVEPFTGEGMAWALGAAELAVPFACEGRQEWSAGLEHRWLRAHREAIGREQRWCRIVSGLLRYPGAVRTVVRALEAEPRLARPVLKHLTP
ncbi:MAG: NAD(P)/FAD-dependent oxidoreductase [Acidobacteriota bacterium]